MVQIEGRNQTCSDVRSSFLELLVLIYFNIKLRCNQADIIRVILISRLKYSDLD